MKKYINFLLKSGTNVRINITKKSYISPITGNRLKTSALLNQQKRFLNDRKYTQKVIRSDKENLFELKSTLLNQKFGEKYLEDYGSFRSSKTRLNEKLYLNFERTQLLELQTELNTRRDVNKTNPNVHKSPVKDKGKNIRLEEEIL